MCVFVNVRRAIIERKVVRPEKMVVMGRERGSLVFGEALGGVEDEGGRGLEYAGRMVDTVRLGVRRIDSEWGRKGLKSAIYGR
jgi:hypothetical protein